MTQIIIFSGYLTVQARDAKDVRAEAERYLEKAALDGLPVLGLYISTSSSLHVHSRPFHHEPPCTCGDAKAFDYEAAVVVAGGQKDRDARMFRSYAFHVLGGYRCVLSLGGAIAYTAEGQRENLVSVSTRLMCPFPGQFPLF